MSIITTIKFRTPHSIAECNECLAEAFSIAERLIDEAGESTSAMVYAHGERVPGTIYGKEVQP